MTPASPFEALKAVPLLRGLPDETLVALSALARRRTFPPNAVICEPDDGGDELHVVMEGYVQVGVRAAVGGPSQRHSLGPGKLHRRAHPH